MTEHSDALRDLQSRVAERIEHARVQQPRRSWLAAEAAGVGFLFPLGQAGEIFPSAQVVALAHARPWFIGVTNLRGGLHGVVDLAAFLGLRPAGFVRADASPREGGRLIALSPSLRVLCALQVDQLAGLRHVDEMAAVAVGGPRPAFAKGLWRDAQGRLWQELDLAELAASDLFLSIAEPETA